MLGLNHSLKMPRLRQNERESAMTYLLQGVSQSEVARRLGVHQSTINCLRKRLQTTGSTADQPRSGRPRVTTERQDRRIRLLHLRDRFRTAVQTALETPGTHNNRIHPKTVRNRLKDFGLTAHRPYVGPLLTPRRRAVWMNWLQHHRPNHFSHQRWRLVLFSDESRFTLFRSDSRQRVYRRRGERFADACVLQRDRFGGGSLLV